ncbi:MAG: tetratricopeptide repeat protein [Candidatus Heimdallarchaeota archaeon]|nr:tetratricopeptide repeat protein [Candidatus Heimdallarchaeota archaeon]
MSLRSLLYSGKYAEILEYDSTKIDDLLCQAWANDFLGNSQQSIAIIEEIKKFEITSFEMIECNIILASSYLSLGEFDTTEKYLDSVENYCQNEPPSYKLDEVKGNYFNIRGSLNSDRGNLKSALDFFNQALKIANQINNVKMKIRTYNNLSINYFYNSDLEMAYKFVEDALNCYTDEEDPTLLLISQNNKALILHSRGDLNEAFELYIKCYDLALQLNINVYISMILNNLAEMYVEYGELDHAIKLYKKCLVIDEQMGNKLYIAFTKDNIANLFRKQGKLDEAKSIYQSNLGYYREIGNPLEISLNLVNLLEVQIQLSETEEARDQLKEIEQIYLDQPQSDTLKLRFLFAKAIMARHSGRAREIFNSIDFLDEIIDDDTIDPDIISRSMLMKAEVLFDELRLYSNNEVLLELIALIDQLEQFSINTTSYSVLINTYLIKSNLLLLQLKIREAQLLLENANQMALEKGYTLLAVQASQQMDALLENINTWDEYSKSKPSLRSRIELSNLKDILEVLLDDKENNQEMSAEKPLLFSIQTKEGLSKFSLKFNEDFSVNEQLIGAFLSALNALGHEAFSTKGNLERVKHHNFTILIKSVDQLFLIYIFEGNSFFAVQRLDKISNILLKSDSLTKLKKSYTPRDQSDIANIIKSIIII